MEENMKTKNIQKKLVLKKQTIVNLNKKSMSRVYGWGEVPTPDTATIYGSACICTQINEENTLGGSCMYC
jgi:hypothetical protein